MVNAISVCQKNANHVNVLLFRDRPAVANRQLASLPGSQVAFQSFTLKITVRMRVPVYSAEGARLRDYSLESVLSLEKNKRIVVKRGSQGQILSARFRSRSFLAAVGTQRLSNTKYSFPDRLDCGRRGWKHKPLPSRNLVDGDRLIGESEIQVRIAGLFCAVTHSVLVEPEPTQPVPPSGARVVCIDSYRSRPEPPEELVLAA